MSAPLEVGWRPKPESWVENNASPAIVRRPWLPHVPAATVRALAPEHPPTNYERRAIDVATAMLEDPATLRSYNSMQNTNRRAVLKELTAWAHNKGVSAKTRDALANALDIKTRADFHAAMHRVIDHVKTWTALEPYALIVEFGKRRGHPEVWPKSSMWLAAPVIRGIGRPPAMIVPYFVYKGGDGSISRDLIRTAVTRGIRSFVHVDDAMYSGDQKMRLIDGFKTAILRDAIHMRSQASKTLRQEKRRLYGNKLGNALWTELFYDTLGTPNERSIRLLVAAAYSTPKAHDRLKKTVLRNAKSLDLFVAGHIPTPRLPANVLADVEALGNDVNASITLLPFKVPNYASFGPQSFGERLERVLPPPPYKKKIQRQKQKEKSR